MTKNPSGSNVDDDIQLPPQEQPEEVSPIVPDFPAQTSRNPVLKAEHTTKGRIATLSLAIGLAVGGGSTDLNAQKASVPKSSPSEKNLPPTPPAIPIATPKTKPEKTATSPSGEKPKERAKPPAATVSCVVRITKEEVEATCKGFDTDKLYVSFISPQPTDGTVAATITGQKDQKTMQCNIPPFTRDEGKRFEGSIKCN